MSKCRNVLPLVLALAACTANGGGQVAQPEPEALAVIQREAVPLTGADTDHDRLLAAIGDARFVLLGEATHGTHEFYRERARITRRLIEEKGYTAMAIEGEWPDAAAVNRFIHGDPGAPVTADEALRAFTTGFPEWMWANTDIRDLVVWMRQYNAARPPEDRVSFYGLDVYSLFESADSVVSYLNAVDPAAAARARERYACFREHDRDPQAYGAAALQDPRASCQEPAAAQAREMEERYAARPRGADRKADDDVFSAMQHAQVVAGAEQYFRLIYRGGPASWNLRDQHMAHTLERIVDHQQARGDEPRIVVWAHNTHSGDARLTEMGQGGELNVGQLMRQTYAARSFLLGFTTYHGTVLAAEQWDSPGRVDRLRPALAESYSALLHQAGIPAFLLVFRGNPALTEALRGPRLERAVGVIYAPRTERQSHYFTARLSEQFDAVIHVDSTTAVTPLP